MVGVSNEQEILDTMGDSPLVCACAGKVTATTRGRQGISKLSYAKSQKYPSRR